MRPTTTNEPDSIYVSKDDKIVIDGLLCYMVHKLHVVNQDALEKVIVSGYSNDAIRASKEKLFKHGCSLTPLTHPKYTRGSFCNEGTDNIASRKRSCSSYATCHIRQHGCSLTPLTHPKYTRGSFCNEGTDNIAKTLKTKLIRVFVTGMVHETNPAEMEKMLKEKMNNNTVKCKLIQKGERSSSFCVSAECLSADEIYDPSLWPEGSYAQRYYSDRKTSQANLRS
ncbi:hypothetical protein CAPTEDRAFT_206148 [Capitella teleta]|uniref:Uncharacterized protein n=1 Tax=Capitella teleta TaxID=283909 RepID=R7UPL3_CAPTE|nr:hypothetical protein CAPTEDRAFT_206148 [Capitella teleta]|eukprot:ELU05887.1 hypothetical protein CAPTEDRAFT_206148 [Capitella teleta]